MENNNSILDSINSHKGILILGGPGTGKTVGPVQNIINKAVSKNISGIIHTNLNINFPNGYSPNILSWKEKINTLKINPLSKSILSNVFLIEMASKSLVTNLKTEIVTGLVEDNSIQLLKQLIIHLHNNFPDLNITQLISFINTVKHEELEQIVSNSSNYPTPLKGFFVEIIGVLKYMFSQIENGNFELYTTNSKEDLFDFEVSNNLIFIDKNTLSKEFSVLNSLIIDIAIIKRTELHSRSGLILLDDANYLKLSNLAELPAVARSCKITVVISEMVIKNVTLIANLGYQIISNSYYNSLNNEGIYKPLKTDNQNSGYFTLYDVLEKTTKELTFDINGNIVKPKILDKFISYFK